MNFPKTLKIGGTNYKIEVVDEIGEDDNTAGKTYTAKQLIRITKGETDFMQTTLLHEILHSINMELKETDVEFFTQALYQVLKDNKIKF
jgi:hypothetical protein